MSNEDGLFSELAEAIKLRRRHAGYFNFDADKEMAELGVVQELAASMLAKSELFFTDFKLRGRGHDPPDVEALSNSGQRIALEVTELVDGCAIQRSKFINANPSSTAQERLQCTPSWSAEALQTRLQGLVTAKDQRFNGLKGSPYPGGYVVVIHTDEPDLTSEKLASLLKDMSFCARYINRCFLIVGYQPFQDHLDYFELTLSC